MRAHISVFLFPLFYPALYCRELSLLLVLCSLSCHTPPYAVLLLAWRNDLPDFVCVCLLNPYRRSGIQFNSEAFAALTTAAAALRPPPQASDLLHPAPLPQQRYGQRYEQSPIAQSAPLTGSSSGVNSDGFKLISPPSSGAASGPHSAHDSSHGGDDGKHRCVCCDFWVCVNAEFFHQVTQLSAAYNHPHCVFNVLRVVSMLTSGCVA